MWYFGNRFVIGTIFIKTIICSTVKIVKSHNILLMHTWAPIKDKNRPFQISQDYLLSYCETTHHTAQGLSSSLVNAVIQHKTTWSTHSFGQHHPNNQTYIPCWLRYQRLDKSENTRTYLKAKLFFVLGFVQLEWL